MIGLDRIKIVAIIGIIIAFFGLTAMIWGLLHRDNLSQMVGFISIIIAYIFTVLIKRMRRKADKKKQG